MANLKISQLTDGSPAQATDLLPIARSGSNFSITPGSIAALNIVAVTNLTAQAAAKTTTTIYAVPASGQGKYRVSAYAKVTTPGTTSVLGGTNGFQLTWTDPTDTTTPTVTFSDQSTQVLNGNTTTTIYSTSAFIEAKASTNIQYAFDYTSTGVTPMQYKLTVKVEYLGA